MASGSAVLHDRYRRRAGGQEARQAREKDPRHPGASLLGRAPAPAWRHQHDRDGHQEAVPADAGPRRRRQLRPADEGEAGGPEAARQADRQDVQVRRHVRRVLAAVPGVRPLPPAQLGVLRVPQPVGQRQHRPLGGGKVCQGPAGQKDQAVGVFR